MKKFAMGMFLIGTILFAATETFAAFINVLSQEYTVEGFAYDDAYPSHNYLENYYAASDSTVSLDTGLVWVNADDEFVGQYKLVMEAGGGVTDYDAWVYGLVMDYASGDIVVHGWTTSVMTFQPLVDSVLVTPHCSYHNFSRIRDLTTDSTLYYFMDSLDPVDLALELDHIYSLEAYTHYDWMGISSCLKIEARPVPEPGTLILLGFGLMGLGVRMKRAKGHQPP